MMLLCFEMLVKSLFLSTIDKIIALKSPVIIRKIFVKDTVLKFFKIFGIPFGVYITRVDDSLMFSAHIS